VPAGNPDGGQWTRLAASDKPRLGPAAIAAIVAETAKRAIQAYRNSNNLWDLFGSRIGAGGSDVDAGRGTNSGSDAGGIDDPRILSDATPDNTWIPGARYAQDMSRRYSIVLEDEPAFKHISKHIGRSDEELRARLNKNYYRGFTVYTFENA
jgi:hypothetical protein